MTPNASLAATVAALRKSALFAGFDDASLLSLCRSHPEEVAPSGQVLMRQGDTGSFAYVLLSGSVEILVETPLGATRVAELGPGELIGEIASLADLPRSATVVTRAPVRMIRIEKSFLLELLQRPELAVSIIRELSLRLQRVHQPLTYLMHAVSALDIDDFEPELLDALTERAGEVTPFAQSFARMLHAFTRRRNEYHEMAIAARLQLSMLPRAPPPLPNVRLDARMLPARIVGGDFFDWFLLPDGRLACAVADVSGKGVPAAFLTGVTRTALRASASLGDPTPARMLAQVNGILADGNDQLMFVSLFLAVLDPDVGTLEWANAGHPPGMRLCGSRPVLLEPTGPVLGIDPDARFATERTRLAAGDRIFLYTDGVTEAVDETGAFFGDQRAAALASALAGLDAPAANEELLAQIRRFAGAAEQADDIACLCLDWRRG